MPMKNLKIQYFKGKSDAKPEIGVTIPFSNLHVSVKFLPKKLKSILDKEEIDVAAFKDLIKEKDVTGTIIEIENTTSKMIILAD